MPYDLNTTPPGIPTQTVRSAARLTRLSEKTIRRRIHSGELTAYRLGRSIRISDDDLLATFERVYTAPTEGEKRIQKLRDARTQQKSYKALRAVQVAQDESGGAETYHRDPVGDAAAYNIDRPVVQLG